MHRFLLAIGFIFIPNFYENIGTDDNGDWKSPNCNNYTCDNLLPSATNCNKQAFNNLTSPPARPQRHN